MQSSSSHFDSESIDSAASNSKRFKQQSTKRKQATMSKEMGKKRTARSSADSFTSDDDSKSANNFDHSMGSRTTEKNRSSKKRRKGNQSEKSPNKSGQSDSNGWPENKLQVAVFKNFPTISKPNYADALNLTSATGSIEEGRKLFGVLIKPIQVSTFMEKYWEQKPIRVQRRFPDYYKDLISTEMIDKMLRENHIEFTKNIDITQYKNGVRETLNPVGRALPPCNYNLKEFRCQLISHVLLSFLF